MADTQQAVDNPQTAGGNLQPNRSDLQPTSTQTNQLAQGGIDQQTLPITAIGLKVQTTEQSVPLPSGVTLGNPTESTSLAPLLVALCAAALLIIALAIWAMRPRTSAEVVPEVALLTKTPKPKAKKSNPKSKPKKKKTKKRS